VQFKDRQKSINSIQLLTWARQIVYGHVVQMIFTPNPNIFSLKPNAQFVLAAAGDKQGGSINFSNGPFSKARSHTGKDWDYPSRML
jgi:hypothetical protein